MAGTLTFGYPGDGGFGDRLLGAVLRGEKTATSSLAIEYLTGVPLPCAGQRLVLQDHAGLVHGLVEVTRVTIIPMHLVGDAIARDEGEGFVDAAAWRRAHVAFWTKVTHLIQVEAADPSWRLRDTEPVVVQWFRLLMPAGRPE